MKTRHPDNFYFLYPDDGAMLTYATGERTENGIRITVRVDASSGRKMTLCGVPMKDEGYGVYSCPVELSDYKTTLVARDEESKEERSIDLYFLKNGYKKYRFSLDDNIWFLQNLTENKDNYTSMFEDPYLALLKKIHDAYGSKFHVNIYYETPRHGGFNLTQMTDKYKDEWKKNSDWLRLSFHANADAPARPYAHTTYEQAYFECERVHREILRFAGEECLSKITTVHCGDCTVESARAFRDLGYRAFVSSYNKTENGVDIRMYNQQELVSAYWSGSTVFGARGPVARVVRGRMGIYSGLGTAITVLITGFVYVFTCLKAWAGAFDIGSITQYVGAATAMAGSIFELTALLGILKANTPYLEKTFEFLDIPNAMYQGSLTTEKRADRQYEVEFKNVSFKYPGSENWALKNVSMKFKVGKRLAIVGENGSGKTTFIKLLCRLYDPQEGQILLNGIDIRKYNYRDYMDVFSIVFQDFQLISQPLGANVAGSSTYDEERVRKALMDAGFGDRLETMPDGLNTQLYKDFTEDGVEVSGGEAQKIAIARALYKDAPFIILDEPTAALDPIAEAEIYSKFNDISGDKTAIYISHRLSSCKFCDEIAVFHEGGVIQQGTHDDLLADTTGKYHELWNAQAQYYTEKTA